MELRQLKALQTGFQITKHNIPLCCQIFFWDVVRTIRSTVPEYQSTMNILTNNDGVILCPDCIQKTLEVDGS